MRACIILVDEVDSGGVLLLPLFEVELDLLVAGLFLIQFHSTLSLQNLHLKMQQKSVTRNTIKLKLTVYSQFQSLPISHCAVIINTGTHDSENIDWISH